MTNDLSVAEKNALSVSYDAFGTRVNLDLDFVKRYLVRGSSEKISDQEVVFFMNLCKMQKMNPLANEVYLIKFGSDPAQTVVGKGAYMRRAFENPDYLCKEDGIVVQRGKEIIQKEGCCIYPGEELIGGWCRVHYMRGGVERTAYKEVSLSEYNKGQANWKSKPATMLNKVAISQCVREAFPRDYEGLYNEDEMVASGAISSEYTATPREVVATVVEEPVRMISQEQKDEIINFIIKNFGAQNGAGILRSICMERGIDSPDKIPETDFASLMSELENMAKKAEVVEEEQAQPINEGFMSETEDMPPFA